MRVRPMIQDGRCPWRDVGVVGHPKVSEGMVLGISAGMPE